MTTYDDEVAILIRLPRTLKARVQEMAMAQRRSMNQQVVVMLGESITAEPERTRITEYVELVRSREPQEAEIDEE